MTVQPSMIPRATMSFGGGAARVTEGRASFAFDGVVKYDRDPFLFEGPLRIFVEATSYFGDGRSDVPAPGFIRKGKVSYDPKHPVSGWNMQDSPSATFDDGADVGGYTASLVRLWTSGDIEPQRWVNLRTAALGAAVSSFSSETLYLDSEAASTTLVLRFGVGRLHRRKVSVHGALKGDGPPVRAVLLERTTTCLIPKGRRP